MFFVLGITWIAEVVLFLLNYVFAYDKGGVDCPSIPTNATIIKASFLFDCINAFQGIIMFCVLVFDASMIRKIRKYFCNNTKKSAKIGTGASLNPKMENISKLNIIEFNSLQTNNRQSATEFLYGWVHTMIRVLQVALRLVSSRLRAWWLFRSDWEPKPPLLKVLLFVAV